MEDAKADLQYLLDVGQEELGSKDRSLIVINRISADARSSLPDIGEIRADHAGSANGPSQTKELLLAVKNRKTHHR